jgi:hypothetical protein
MSPVYCGGSTCVDGTKLCASIPGSGHNEVRLTDVTILCHLDVIPRNRIKNAKDPVSIKRTSSIGTKVQT